MGWPKGRPRKRLVERASIAKQMPPEKREEILKQVAEIDSLLMELQEKDKQAKATNPFWFFEPNTGELTDERKQFLRRYLKEEDIPEKVDGQLDALLSRVEIKGVSGGNRSSKTVTGTIDGLIKSTGELPIALESYRDSHYAGIVERARNKFIKGRITAVDNKQLHRVVLDAWKKWTPKEYLLKGSWEQSYSKEFDILTLYRDRKPCASIEFLTNAQDVESSQGGDLDWAKFDEEPEQAKYKETLMRFGTADRLDIEIDWTPTNGLTWATELFHDGVLTDTEGESTEIENSLDIFKLTTVCNRFVDLDTMQKIMDAYAKVSSYDEMKMRLLGEAISLSGLVYGQLFNKSVHVIPPFFEGLDVYHKRQYLGLSGLDPHLVTPTPIVFMLLDREGNTYVDRCWMETADTVEIKTAWHRIVKESGYRMGWSVADKSADSSIMAFGGRNIFKELSRGSGMIPALRTSEKYEGSIKAGVDDIKKRLKDKKFFIVDRPENKLLINSFRTLERDTYADEDKNGQKDRIKEGKHHLHAAMRYIFQFPLHWHEEVTQTPEVEYQDAAACW